MCQVMFSCETTANVKMAYKREWMRPFARQFKMSIEVNVFSLVISTDFLKKV